MYNYGYRNNHLRYGRGDETASNYPAHPKTSRLPNEQLVSIQETRKLSRDYGRDNIYFNIEISNPLRPKIPPFSPFVTDQASISAEFYENLTQPILSNPSEYYVTIARFSVPGLSIPIIDMDIIYDQADPTNPNLTPYVLTLSFGGMDFAENIYFYTTTNQPLPPPPSAPTYKKFNSTYYYVFEYNEMIEMMNITLLRAFTRLKLMFPAAPPTEAPFFIFDEKTELISLVAQNSYSEVIAGAATIQIFCNSLFYTRFVNSLMAKFFGDNQANGKDLQLLFPPTTIPVPTQITTNPFGTQLLRPKFNDLYAITAPIPANAFAEEPRNYTETINNPALAGVPNAYLFNTQEFISLQYWNSFKNIVFTSSSLPIQAEYIPSHNNSTGTQGSGVIAYKPILTDFIPLLPRAGDARTYFLYNPTGPYRLIDMLGTAPLQKIDIKIFWEDIYGDLHLLDILANQSASVKMLFIKKEDI